MKANIVQKEFPNFKVCVLSVGKRKLEPLRNEDGWVATKDTFAVIDGSAPRVDLKLGGKSTARFATDVVVNVLLKTSPTVNGKDLVLAITESLNKEINRAGFRDIIQKSKEASPASLFTSARTVGDKLIITGLGDISCRINGKVIHCDRFKSEDLMTKKRISAMKKTKKKNPDILDEELLKIGQEAIKEDLIYQVKNYFNKADISLGLGIIDGQEVPKKFIKEYIYDLKNIKTLELFSDGYYILPKIADIESWEEGFVRGEKEDPMRWSKYPAVKAVFPNQFSDDRTILIVSFNN